MASQLKADPARKPGGPPQGPSGGKARGRRRRWAWILGGLLASPLLLLAVLLALLQLAPVQRGVVGLVEKAVPGLRIGELAGTPPFDVRVRALSLRDADGIWLHLDRGRLAWRPLGLLTGTFDVSTLGLGSLEVARAPVAETASEDPGKGGGLPRLPIGLRVQDFEVDRLVLGAPLLGERLELGISGRLAARDTRRVETALRVERLDGEGRVDLSAVYGADDRRLKADLAADAPAGGLVSRLSGLPGAPPISVRLAGEGPLADWSGAWRVAAGQVAQAEGRLVVAGLAPPAVRLSGRAELAAALPPDLQALVTPAIGFALTGRYGDVVELEIERVESDALALLGSATAHLAAETLEADLSAELLDPAALTALAAPLEVAGARLRATARGPLAAPRVELRATAENLRIPPFAADTASVMLEGPAALPAELVVDAEAVGLSGPNGTIDALGERLTLFAQADVSTAAARLTRLTLQTPALTANGDGALEFAAPRGDLALRLAYPALERFQALTGVPLRGGLEAQLYGSLAESGAVSGMLTGRFATLDLGIPAADALLGPAPELWAEAALGTGGGLRLSAFGLDGDALALSGQGGLEAGELTAQLRASLPELARLQAAGLPLAGAAELDLAAEGSLDTPQVSARLSSTRLEVDGVPLRDVALRAETAGLPPALSGRLALEAGTPAGAVALDAGLRVGGESLLLEDLRVARAPDRLTGRLAMPLSGPPVSGRLSLSVADLGAYAELLPELRSGGLTTEVDLAAQDGQTAEVELQLRDLGLADGTRVAAAQMSARLRDLLAVPTIEGNAEVRQAVAGDLTLERIALAADGRLDALAFELEAAGRAGAGPARALTATVGGTLALSETVRVDLARLQAGYGDVEARLRGPARLVYGPRQLEVEGLGLALSEGEIDLDARLAEARIEAELAVRGLPLELAEAAGLDVPLAGSLQARASVSGALPQPSGSLTLRTENLRVKERVAGETLPLDLSVEGTLDGGRFEAQAELSGFARESLQARVSLPLLVRNAPPGIELPRDAPIRVTSAWTGELAPIVGLLPVDVVRIEGNGNLDLEIEGTLEAPRASGQLSVTEGVYENFTLGTLLRPFALRLEGEGSRLVLREFSAEDPGGGSLSVDGWIDLAGAVPSFEIAAQMRDLDVARRDDLSVTTDADLGLAGDVQQASLTGSVTLQRADISLAGEVPASIPTLEVQEINTGRPQEEVPEEGDGQGLAFLGLDVELSIPGRLFIRGRGLESEWQGQFRLTGTAAEPRLQGDLQPVRGFFDLAGKQFALETGRISFTGDSDFDPQLDLTTVYEEDGFTARIRVTGSASAPDLQLSSSPPLPNDEILARILFGQSTARLTAVQAVQIAQAAAALTGGGGGVLDYARSTLGVDVLTFAPGTDDGDLGAVEAGRYLGDDVFVGVRQGATPGSSGAVVEWEILPSLKLESQVGAGTEANNLGLQWEWEY